MSSGQPLNTDISVFRRVRVQTDQDRHDPIKGMGRFRDRQVIVPSQEIRTLETKDSVETDAWRYGHPVVRYIRGNTAPTPIGEQTKTLQQVYDNVSGLHIPLRLTVERRDMVIEKAAAHVQDDLFTEVRGVPSIPPIDLGDYSGSGGSRAFTILSKSGITNIGAFPATNIEGDIGTSPITGAAITGITCAELSGTIHTTNGAGAGSLPCAVTDPAVLTAAVDNMVAAYNTAAGLANPHRTELGDGEIGGMVLTPGIYKWSTDLNISTNVTLSGSGSWVFQISGRLIVANAARVLLAGGANAANIIWQVGSAAPIGVAIGTTAHIEGTVLAATTIAMNTNATAHGQLLSQTSVTLLSNVITKS